LLGRFALSHAAWYTGAVQFRWLGANAAAHVFLARISGSEPVILAFSAHFTYSHSCWYRFLSVLATFLLAISFGHLIHRFATLFRTGSAFSCLLFRI